MSDAYTPTPVAIASLKGEVRAYQDALARICKAFEAADNDRLRNAIQSSRKLIEDQPSPKTLPIARRVAASEDDGLLV